MARFIFWSSATLAALLTTSTLLWAVPGPFLAAELGILLGMAGGMSGSNLAFYEWLEENRGSKIPS